MQIIIVLHHLTARNDLLIIMVDLNAKVGSSKTDFEKVMGNHGIGVKKDKVERLVIVKGSIFLHREIHVY